MPELLTDDDKLEFQRKMRVKRRFRGLLIVLNMLLACYLVFAAGTAIVELVDNKTQSKDTVLLCGKSEGASLKLYNEYVKESVSGDFAIYGDNLHLRKTNYDVNKKDAFENVQLVNVCSKSGVVLASNRYVSHGDVLNTGINLFNDINGKMFEEGYYIFYSDYIDINNRGKVVRVNTDEKLEHVIFSTPNHDGKRVKATILSYPKNKALLLKIEQVNKIAESYYDTVVYGDIEKTASFVSKLEDSNLKVKILDSSTNSYSDVYRVNASHAFVLKSSDVEIITVSSKIDSTHDKSDDDVFSQLGAYAFLHGSLAEFYSMHTPGKMTVCATFNETMSEQIINELSALIIL